MAILNAEDEHDLPLDLALGGAKERIVAGGQCRAVDVCREVANGSQHPRIESILRKPIPRSASLGATPSTERLALNAK